MSFVGCTCAEKFQSCSLSRQAICCYGYKVLCPVLWIAGYMFVKGDIIQHSEEVTLLLFLLLLISWALCPLGFLVLGCSCCWMVHLGFAGIIWVSCSFFKETVPSWKGLCAQFYYSHFPYNILRHYSSCNKVYGVIFHEVWAVLYCTFPYFWRTKRMLVNASKWAQHCGFHWNCPGFCYFKGLSVCECSSS